MAVRSTKVETRNSKSAFTLIELIVVVAVVSLLLAAVSPTLTRVRERAVRTICQSNMRSFHIAATAYAADNDNFLPQGGIAAPYNYTIVMRPSTYESLGGEFVCPNLFNPFKGNDANIFKGGSHQKDNGYYLLGYNYLAGFSNTPWALSSPDQAEWKSPQKNTDSSRLPIIAELNTWISGTYKITFAPHGLRGAIHESNDSTNMSHNGIPPDQIGAVGGNVCLLDGTITWKAIGEMSIHRASEESSTNLQAYW